MGTADSAEATAAVGSVEDAKAAPGVTGSGVAQVAAGWAADQEATDSAVGTAAAGWVVDQAAKGWVAALEAAGCRRCTSG